MARGIASITDAIFLVVVAAISSAIILSAVSNYGQNFEQYAHRLLNDIYAKQVIRVLTVVPVEREGGGTDYLLSYMKESFDIREDFKPVKDKLKEVISKAMEPATEMDYKYAVIFDGGTRFTIAVSGDKDVSKVCEGFDLENWLSSIRGSYSSEATLYFRREGVYFPVKVYVVLYRYGELLC